MRLHYCISWKAITVILAAMRTRNLTLGVQFTDGYEGTCAEYGMGLPACYPYQEGRVSTKPCKQYVEQMRICYEFSGSHDSKYGDDSLLSYCHYIPEVCNIQNSLHHVQKI
jgi:hypothetical protein